MKKLILLSAVLFGTAVASQAGVHVNIGISLPIPAIPVPGRVIVSHPAPVIVERAPVYAPAPVIVAPRYYPAPRVVCAPPPVVYAPPPVVYVQPRGYYSHPSYHHGHSDWGHHGRWH